VADQKPAIGIVGAGPVARTLGRLLYLGHAPVVALSSRTAGNAADAARVIGSTVDVVPLRELASRVGRVLIATNDAGIADVAGVLARFGFAGTALHTCGARGPEALQPLRTAGASCAVLHPLQTFTPRADPASLRGVTFALAGDPEAVEWGREIVALAEGRTLAIAPDRMALYHAGAVMAGNAVIAAVDAAVQLLASAGVSETEAIGALGPLCRASLENSLRDGPVAAVTGPVVRGDMATIRLHLAALQDRPAELAELYRSSGRYLVDLARRRGASTEHLQALVSAFDIGQAGDEHGFQTNAHL
jgi:predicted short-subunit dehydrogenase-like oxidoreductase (DUF2520 family)